LIDTEDPKYVKMKADDFKNWESGVQGICSALNIGTDEYYRRRLGMYRSLLLSSIERRDANTPMINEHSYNKVSQEGE
jgi:hypothetical protein